MRKIKDLKKADYNPRKISNKQMEDLKESIRTFGMVEPVIVNMHSKRKNIVVGGHQRIDACEELGETEVPTYEVKLTKEKEMELNIRLNKSGGTFDFDILDEFFDKDNLLDFGFIESEFPIEVPEDLKEVGSGEEPVYPIVPVLSEKYDYVVIMATNEVDVAYLENFFDLQVQKSYKNSKVGVGRVVPFDKFRKIVEDERVG